jgi:CheY-like chemotaxis protein
MTQRTILVVEDDPIIGVLLVDMLTSMGHTVCGLRTSEADAITGAAAYDPDLMLVDVRLGSGSGVRAVTEIRRFRNIPYVFMTGAVIPVGGPEDVVLYKPFQEPELAAAIIRVLP